MTEKQLKMVREHSKRMFNMRFMGLDWQEIHQKRWDENTDCEDDVCDCEAIWYKDKGILFFDGTKG